MKKITHILSAAVAAVALAVTPPLAAQAAPTQTATITQAWGQQYQTLVNPADTMQAVIDNENSAVYFVDLATNAVTQVTDTNTTFNSPYRGAFSPDGTQLFIGNYSSGAVSVINVSTATVIDSFFVDDDEATAIGVSPDGNTFIFTDDHGYIFRYDIANNYNVIGSSQSIPNEAIGMYFPSATSALIVDEYGYLYNYDLTTGTIGSGYGDALPDYSYGVCASPDLSTIYVTDYANGQNLYAIDSASGAVTTIDLTSVNSSTSYATCSVSKDGKKVFVTDWNNDNSKAVVVTVDATLKTATGVIDITGLAADDPTSPSYPVGLTDGINVFSDCKFIVNGYYGNAAIVDFCEPELPNTGVDTVAMDLAAASGLALVALGALAVMFVRRRASR